MTTLEAIEYLRSPAGAAALRAAAELSLEDNAFLTELTRLRRRLSPERAAAVIEQVALRRRGAAKFHRAAEMLFTADGLEQASGETLSAHSAQRFHGYRRVADMCCGIGGDTLALASHAHIDAYDLDPVRLACLEHNAAAYGLADRIDIHLADAARLDLTQSTSQGKPEALFFDPSRRAGGHRIFSLADYHPPVSLAERWLANIPAIGVKVAPGVSHDEVVWECEQEFVAEGRDLKEGLLWFGPLAGVTRRATVLPGGATLVAGDPLDPETSEPLAWLFDPSPAVTRAGLVRELAALLGARQLDPALAYLTGPERVETPLAGAYPIEAWLPFSLKRLKARLRALGVGGVEVRRRGAPIEPAELERRLRQEGDQRRLLFLTRLRGRMIAVICRPPSA